MRRRGNVVVRSSWPRCWMQDRAESDADEDEDDDDWDDECGDHESRY